MLVHHVKTRRPVAWGAVQLQQLGVKSSQLLNQTIRGIGFSNQAWDIPALGHPDTGLAVPLCLDFVNAVWDRFLHGSLLSRKTRATVLLWHSYVGKRGTLPVRKARARVAIRYLGIPDAASETH